MLTTDNNVFVQTAHYSQPVDEQCVCGQCPLRMQNLWNTIGETKYATTSTIPALTQHTRYKPRPWSICQSRGEHDGERRTAWTNYFCGQHRDVLAKPLLNHSTKFRSVEKFASSWYVRWKWCGTSEYVVDPSTHAGDWWRENPNEQITQDKLMLKCNFGHLVDR